MNRDKFIFAQFADFLGHNKFRRLVDKYNGDVYVKHFTCWNHLLTLMFGQLSGPTRPATAASLRSSPPS